MDEARRACERLSTPPGQPAVGVAFYQQAELHRLRGEFARGRGGVPPGQPVGSRAAARPGAAAAGPGPGRRRRGSDPPRGGRGAGPGRPGPGCSPRYVEIVLAADDVPAARAAADELSEIAADARRAVAAGRGRPRHRRRPARRGRRPRRPGRAAPGVDGLAGARGAVRGRAGPGPDRPRLPGARATRTPRRWSWTRRAGSSSSLGAAPDLARVEALSRTATPERRAG